MDALESSSTADRLIMAAMRLFAEKGYGSTSVADILREAGANSGSLYHAFPTKQDLLLAVLRRYRDGIGPMLLAPAWEGVDDPIERVFALLAAYRAHAGRHRLPLWLPDRQPGAGAARARSAGARTARRQLRRLGGGGRGLPGASGRGACRTGRTPRAWRGSC